MVLVQYASSDSNKYSNVGYGQGYKGVHVRFRGVGKLRPVRLRLISASNNCRVKVRIWVRFRVRVGRLIQVA